jgi:hypothetical protein
MSDDKARRIELSGNPAMLEMHHQRKLAKVEAGVWELIDTLKIEDREKLLRTILAVVAPAAEAARSSLRESVP